MCQQLFYRFCNSTCLILQIPHAIFVRKLLITSATLREDATLEATHVEEQVRVVLAVHRHKAVLPLNCGHRTREAILDVPEHSTAPVRLLGINYTTCICL